MGRVVEWKDLMEVLLEHYGLVTFDDTFGELCKSKQVGTVREYHGNFESLMGRAGSLTEQQKASLFISRLKDSLRADVKAQNPSTLTATISLARVYENKIKETKKFPLETRAPNFQKKNSSSLPGAEEGENQKFLAKEFLVWCFTPTELKQRH